MQRPSGISLSDLFAICREDPANRMQTVASYQVQLSVEKSP